MRLLFIVLISGLLAITACSRSDEPVEERVQALVSHAESAAESRQIDFFDDLLSEQYQDDHGNSRIELLRLLQAYYFRHKSIYLVSRTHEILESDNGSLQVVVFVGMAGSPDTGFEQLKDMRADLYRLEFSLTGTDPFQVSSARWRRATPAELFAVE